MQNSIKNQGKFLGYFSLRQAYRVGAYLVFVLSLTFWLSACATSKQSAQLQKSVNKSHFLGELTVLAGTPVFSDKLLSRPLNNVPSHGVVLSAVSPYRILLSDGRLAWLQQVSNTLPLHVKIVSDTANFSNIPQAQQGESYFEWLDYSQEEFFSLLSVGDSLYEESPIYIEQQGRKLNSKVSYFWPQMQIKSQSNTGWVSAQYLAFLLKDGLITMAGLIQKPFLPLSHKYSRNPLEGIERYWEYSYQEVKSLPLPKKEWSIEQAVYFDRSSKTEIESIELVSSTDNCNVVFVEWRTGNKDSFGYCDAGVEAPTPFIAGYGIHSAGEGVSITLLEITGDEAREVQYLISHSYKREGSVRIINN